jgi:phosphoenolpyruvate synthase/pyruvate phosphate dikinase
VAAAIEAGYARLGGDGTVVTVRTVGGSGGGEVFRDLRTTHDVLAACKRCYGALFTDEAIAGREKRGLRQLDVAMSIGIERQNRPAATAESQSAPPAADCSGYVVDDAELRKLAAWAVALERNHARLNSATRPIP